MRLNSPWQPRLAPGEGTPCARLVTALAEDIAQARLTAGDRLPAHRDLAWRLGIGLGTVTKAYGLLERRGLVRAVRGSGMFVAAAGARASPQIDLSRNAPPAALTDVLLSRTLSRLAKRTRADLWNAYPPTTGEAAHRQQMARWFARAGLEAEARRIFLTNGAQHALALALDVVFAGVEPHETVLFVERQTYPGALALARQRRVPLVGVDLDDAGMVPAALERALATHHRQRRLVYLVPTMHNPTTATMDNGRRHAIVAVCRAHDARIVEDDVYTLEADPQRPPLARLAPERTLYVNSLSKTLNPALRIGGLVVPPDLVEVAEAALAASGLVVSPISCAVMEQWLLDGTADAIADAVATEADRRTALARSILGLPARPSQGRGYHLWLPMVRADAERLALAARAADILLTPPSATMANPQANPSGVRLCVGAPALDDLTQALGALARLLASLHPPAEMPGPAHYR